MLKRVRRGTTRSFISVRAGSVSDGWARRLRFRLVENPRWQLSSTPPRLLVVLGKGVDPFLGRQLFQARGQLHDAARNDTFTGKQRLERTPAPRDFRA